MGVACCGLARYRRSVFPPYARGLRYGVHWKFHPVLEKLAARADGGMAAVNAAMGKIMCIGKQV